MSGEGQQTQAAQQGTMRAWQDQTQSLQQGSGDGKAGGQAQTPVQPAMMSQPMHQQNYGAGRFIGNPGMQQGASWRPQTYQARGLQSSGVALPGQPGGDSGGLLGGYTTDRGGDGGMLGGMNGDVNIGPGLSNPFSEEGRTKNDLASLYGLNQMTVTPGFFGPGGEGYSVGQDGGALGGFGDTGGLSSGGIGGYGGYGDSNAGFGDVGLSDGGFGVGGYGDGVGGYGGDTGDSDGGDSDSGDGWAKGGKVTRARLVGPNPKGKDDGYGALDVGEIVVPADKAKKMSKKQVHRLIGRKK